MSHHRCRALTPRGSARNGRSPLQRAGTLWFTDLQANQRSAHRDAACITTCVGLARRRDGRRGGRSGCRSASTRAERSPRYRPEPATRSLCPALAGRRDARRRGLGLAAPPCGRPACRVGGRVAGAAPVGLRSRCVRRPGSGQRQVAASPAASRGPDGEGRCAADTRVVAALRGRGAGVGGAAGRPAALPGRSGAARLCGALRRSSPHPPRSAGARIHPPGSAGRGRWPRSSRRSNRRASGARSHRSRGSRGRPRSDRSAWSPRSAGRSAGRSAW